jgi:hypothetical protein
MVHTDILTHVVLLTLVMVSSIISQRYSKLCLMLYKANGIKIDESGNLGIPPRFENFEDIPRASLRTLRPVNPPTVFNVHRWSLEEDLTLLKAVPKMGHMWAGKL